MAAPTKVADAQTEALLLLEEHCRRRKAMVPLSSARVTIDSDQAAEIYNGVLINEFGGRKPAVAHQVPHQTWETIDYNQAAKKYGGIVISEYRAKRTSAPMLSRYLY